jgi:hypothetical protein
MIHKLITLPIRAMIALAEKIKEEADRELYDLPSLQQKLIQLHMMYELHEIDEELYLQKEQELLRRYKISKERERENLSNE